MKVLAVILAALVAVAAGETCEGAQVEAVGFTSRDATIVTKIAYIADFTLSCSNGAKDVSLYAETADGIVGVARSVDGLKYGVSWIEDVSAAASGDHPIKLYDEQGYAALRKAQRGNEDSASVTPIATINLYHPGAYKGPWVQSETMAIIFAILIYYYAFTLKAKLVA
ncbi:translocon-associated protein subunit delta [Penaeus vannamei]|uniref:Translocon-associated protein subunit delta n=1 Tax=Penaeus vannamei TaxID=6689 RepID=A0A3R7PYH8_PENVA|nr:translocon-associated protein subunit delta-like [Penaeus vannamei]XP_037791610.1 translocon-associated protein subunit delta-like [Penaeus monodon]ROT81022.1 trap [Penaeus vannamei]